MDNMISDGTQKIKVRKDKKYSNSSLFRISKEDHTLGNILHYKLLGFKDVIFCAYKKPHPLENFLVLKIITNENLTPTQAFDCSLKDLYIELSVIEEEFKNAIIKTEKSH